MMSDIIIPATMSSDCLMSESLDLFAADIIPNSFPLSTENNVFQEGDPLDHLELSPNKRYALWKKDTVEYWNPWWRQVLSLAKTDDKFDYFIWSKPRDQQSGSILSRVLISGIVLLSSLQGMLEGICPPRASNW